MRARTVRYRSGRMAPVWQCLLSPDDYVAFFYFQREFCRSRLSALSSCGRWHLLFSRDPWNTEMPRHSTRFDVHGRVHFALSQPITHRSQCVYAPSVAVAVKEGSRYPVLAPCPAWGAARCLRGDGGPRTRPPAPRTWATASGLCLPPCCRAPPPARSRLFLRLVCLHCRALLVLSSGGSSLAGR
jgi:hypothetical protein